MERKKFIAIIVISLITVGTVIALIPVFVYGFGVNALSFDMGFGLSGSPSVSQSGSYNTMDFGGSSSFSVDVNSKKVNPYEYFFRQFEGEVKTEGQQLITLLDQYIDIVIYINITTPNAQKYELSFNLEDLVNILTQSINVLLGPDEIEIVSGTYTISLAVGVSISIPDFPPSGYYETFYFGPYTFDVDVVVE